MKIRIPQFLGIQVGPFLADQRQVDPHALEDLLGDHGGQEPVEGLLGAAVGVSGEVGQGVDAVARLGE